MKMGKNILLSLINIHVFYYLMIFSVNDISGEYVDINSMFENIFLAFV